MVAVFTSVALALISILHVEAVFNGKGEIYFSHYNEFPHFGIRTIYRPENYLRYSKVGEGVSAYLSFAGYTSIKELQENHRQEIVLQGPNDRADLTWHTEGQYYYHDLSSFVLEHGYFFAYGVLIYDVDDKLIYEDSNHIYVVPSMVEYCELDDEALETDTKCSEAINGSLPIKDLEGNKAIFNGKGEIYFSHFNEFRHFGIRTIYRPENYLRYSKFGEGVSAYLTFAGYTSIKELQENHRQEIILKGPNDRGDLTWQTDGHYYYHDQTTYAVEPGDLFAYGVLIYDADDKLIYEDSNHIYVVPSKVKYCELDDEALETDTKCSEAIKGSLPIKDLEGHSFEEVTPQVLNVVAINGSLPIQNLEGNAGVIAAGVIVPLVAIAIIIGVFICVKRGHCERVKAALPTISTISLPKMSSQSSEPATTQP